MRLLFVLVASRPILLLVFCLVVLPVGLIMRAAGRDPMARKFDRSATSYRSASFQRAPDHMEHD